MGGINNADGNAEGIRTVVCAPKRIRDYFTSSSTWMAFGAVQIGGAEKRTAYM